MALPIKVSDEAISSSTVTYTVPAPTGSNLDIFTLTLQADGADIRMWDNLTEANTGTDNYFTIRNGASLTINTRYVHGTSFYFKRDASTDARLEIFYIEGVGT